MPTEVRLTYPAAVEPLSHEDWRENGRTLARWHRSFPWLVGDWLKTHRGEWGDMYAEAKELTGFAYGTLANALTVAKAFEFSRRREKLSWAHHAAVAALEPAEADRLLNAAEADDWKRSRLREEVGTLTAAAAVFPPGKYRVIYADPPWDYGDARRGMPEYENSAAAAQYPTMPTSAICDQLARGREIEVNVAEALIVGGDRFALLASDFNGKNGDKAPSLWGRDKQLIMPDLLVCGSGRAFLVEVKGYDNARWYGSAQEWRHGIARRHCEQYQHVQCVSGLQVYLAIYERSTAKILLGRLGDLVRRVQYSDSPYVIKVFGHAMAFFPRDAFHWRLRADSGRIEPVDLEEIDAECAILEPEEKRRYPHESKIDMSTPASTNGRLL